MCHLRYAAHVRVWVCARVCFLCLHVCGCLSARASLMTAPTRPAPALPAGNLIVPHEPFELLVRRSVMALLPPALACKEAIYSELLAIAEQACPAEAARWVCWRRQGRRLRSWRGPPCTVHDRRRPARRACWVHKPALCASSGVLKQTRAL